MRVNNEDNDERIICYLLRFDESFLYSKQFSMKGKAKEYSDFYLDKN